MTNLHRRVTMTVALATLGAGCAANDSADDVVVVTAPQATSAPSVPDESGGTSDGTTANSRPSTTAAPSPSTAPTSSSVPSIDLGAIEASATSIGTFERPVGLTARGGDPALYVIEQTGTIRRVDGDEAVVVLDIGELTEAAGERGLLGLAFHPSRPLAYVNYTDRDDDTVVAEYAVGTEGMFDAQSARVVLTIDQPYGNHNGGGLEFGPDGQLYISVGDGGSAGDPERRASDPTSLLGSLLRIDPTGRADGAYTIPDDNPFDNEVWAYGLRNPWRFTFNGGDLWIADVGQNEFEEVNLVRSPSPDTPAGRGANFGWSAFEATTRYNLDVEDPDDTVMPVLFYDHADGSCSVSGAAMIERWFVYGDYCSGIVWAFDADRSRNVRLLEGFESITAISNGPDGDAFVIEGTGTISRIDLD